MTRRLTLIVIIILAFCLSVVGILAQETENTFPGEGEVITFFNNLGIDGEIVYGNSANDRDGEANWCYEGERWGNGRCEYNVQLFEDYTWRIGWILAHCEIPGYFTDENRPEECDLLRDNLVNVSFGVSTSSGSSTSTSSGSTSSNTAPSAAFSYTCTDLVCSFNGSGSSDSDGTIVSYSWAFGDGDTGTASSLTHTFAADGTYTVSLTVTDDDGATATTSQPITVADGSGGGGASNIAPTASFITNCTDLGCTFDASASGDSDGSIVTYAWSFGDSGGASGVNSSHTYGSGNTYNVTLTVTDDDGATGTSSQNVTVTDPVVNNPPTASFTYTCTDLDCTFSAAGSSDSDGSIVSYSWSFGDGGGASGISPSHSYGSGNTYTTTLTVTDNDGASASSSASVTVTDPVVNTTLSANYTCSGSDIIVNIVSGDAPFEITGGGPAITGLGIGSHNIGARNGNIKVTELAGDLEQVSVGTNIC